MINVTDIMEWTIEDWEEKNTSKVEKTSRKVLLNFSEIMDDIREYIYMDSVEVKIENKKNLVLNAYFSEAIIGSEEKLNFLKLIAMATTVSFHSTTPTNLIVRFEFDNIFEDKHE